MILYFNIGSAEIQSFLFTKKQAVMFGALTGNGFPIGSAVRTVL